MDDPQIAHEAWVARRVSPIFDRLYGGRRWMIECPFGVRWVYRVHERDPA